MARMRQVPGLFPSFEEEGNPYGYGGNTGVSGYGGGIVPPPIEGQDPVNTPDFTSFDGGVPPPPKTPPPPPPPTWNNQPNGPEAGPTNTFARTPENMPGGVDPTKWTGGHISPKYAWGEIYAQSDMKTPEGRQAALTAAKTQFPQYFSNATFDRDILRLGDNLHEDFNGLDAFDVLVDFEGQNGFGWQPIGGPRYDEFLRSQSPSTPPQSPWQPDGGMGGQFAPQQRTSPQFRGFDPRDAGMEFTEPGNVGQDPFSRLITGGLASLIMSGGSGISNVGKASEQALMDRLGEGREFDPSVANAKMESARENAERWRKGQTDTLKANLADRGLLGSGPERTGLERIALDMEGIGATALRDIYADEFARQGGEQLGAIGMGLGAGESANRTLLDTLQAGTSRQLGLSQIALESLSQNMAWNQFLAEFGLNRDVVMEQLQQGRMDQLAPLIQMFIQLANTARSGYVGS